MLVGEAFKYAQSELAAYSDSSRLDAELLLAHALGKPRSYALAWPEKLLPAKSEQTLTHLVEQRKLGTPVAYLLGQQEFWSIKLNVGPGVLVPRPDTELLVELALGFELPERARVADLGTGSGAIALALATERPSWKIDAVDCHAAALQCAQQNKERLQLNNVTVRPSSWCTELEADRYHLIVSNPPYIADNDPHLQRGGLQFEPRVALAAGEQGMDDLEEIITEAARCLNTNGILLLEHGYDQAAAVKAVLLSNGWLHITQVEDLAGHLRVSRAHKPI